MRSETDRQDLDGQIRDNKAPAVRRGGLREILHTFFLQRIKVSSI